MAVALSMYHLWHGTHLYPTALAVGVSLHVDALHNITFSDKFKFLSSRRPAKIERPSLAF